MPSLTEVRLLTNSLCLDATPPDIAAWVQNANVADWAALITHADRHSLTPLLYSVWRAAEALPYLPAPIRARLQQAYADNQRRNANIRAELLELQALLNQNGVPHLVLKGWPLVEQLYADPPERVLYDHDVLVPAERAQTGHAALKAAGFRPLPGKDEWVEKHLPSLWKNDGYVWSGYLFDPLYPRPVELHVQLWENGWRGLAVRALPEPWHNAQTRLVASVPMQTLSPENMAVHLAMHFAGHLVEREARLNQLLDFARLLARVEFDWDFVVRQAEAANVSRFVYASIFLAREIYAAPLPPPSIWQKLATRTPRPFQAWLAAHGVADVLLSDYQRRTKGKDYKLTFLAARSVREKLGILRFAALPPLGQLQAKYRVQHKWQAALFLPVHLWERGLSYGRGWLKL
ncbi:MAG: nucleotidyltransferase family protein [Anaerolineales bacterium]|nr:nucleotidyltransferase family protein [Anaerolineales bacterium]